MDLPAMHYGHEPIVIWGRWVSVFATLLKNYYLP